MARESTSATEQTPRRLWQAPLFVVGLAALAAAWLLRPLLPSTPGDLISRDLQRIRAELAQPDGDLHALLTRGQRALEEAEAVSERVADANMVVGSVHLRLGDSAEGQAQTVHFQAARQHFEKAETLGVAEAEGKRLNYLLGKAGLFTGDDPARVISRLSAGIDGAETRVEALQLLTRANLRLSPPNLEAAIKFNEMLRQTPLVGEEILGPARLQAGEILLRQRRPEDARKVLERVGERAPASVVARARCLRAQTYQDESRWADAAPLWLQVLADPSMKSEAARVLYYLGMCQVRTGQSAEAVKTWEECLRINRGLESSAAALALAELQLGENAHDKALESLGRGADGVSNPGEWKNPLLDLNGARQVFEKAVAACRLARRHELALQATTLYERLAAPGRAALLQAENAAEWARGRAETARQAMGDAKAREEQAARDLYCASADAYVKAAAAQAKPEEGVELLWQAAARALDGRDFAKAAGLLERVLPRTTKTDRAGEGWYLLGRARVELGDEAAAVEAWNECIKHPTPFAYRARYQRALVAMKNGELDEAEASLKQNLEMLRLDPDGEAQEKSLFAIGDLLYKRKNYRAVVRRLEEALERYPANADATRARYNLAVAYRAVAAEELLNETLEYKTPEAREHARRENRRLLQAAADQFTELSKLVEKPETAVGLTPDEIMQAPFNAAACRYNLGQFEESLQIYEAIAARYPDRVERINALANAVTCLYALRRFDEIPSHLAEVRAAIATMDDGVKAQWEKWLKDASKRPTAAAQ